MLLGAAAIVALAALFPSPDASPDFRLSAESILDRLIGVAHAQEGPDDDDDDDDDDDAGGDGVGDDDLGNDGAGDGDDVGEDDAGTGDDDTASGGGDDPGDDDDGPGDDGADGDDGQGVDNDDGPAGDDEGPGTDDDTSGDDDADDRGRSVRNGEEPRGGAGVRGLDGDGGMRIRDGDRDVAGPSALPAGVDVDFEGRWIREGEILALEADPTSLELARGLGFQIVERYRLTTLGLSIVELRVPRGQQTRAALAAVRRADPDTAYDFNHVYTPTRTTSAAAQTVVSIAQLAGVGAIAENGTIGIIDTGVDVGHPALARANIVQADFLAREARAPAASPKHHGTAVASILVGRSPSTRNSRSGARLFAANVVGRANGTGGELASADSMVRALDWLARNNAPVANISLAGPPNALVQDAIRRAQARGMIVVAAVGNDGPAAPPLYPAAYDGVVGVTAVDANGAVYRRAGRGSHVDVAAFGVDVDVAAPGGARSQLSGTSFAAPLVAASLANAHPRPDPASAQKSISTLFATVRDAGERGRDPVYGAGILVLGTSPR
jgi:hypothetical protein